MADISPIDMQKALKGANYPVGRNDLVALAKQNGADNDLIEKLSNCGAEQFDGPNDVQKAVFDGE